MRRPEVVVSGLDGAGTCASQWFGCHFGELHPELQVLHREGGVLRGEVQVRSGEGMGGMLGRRLARRMGIPVDRPVLLEVRIRHGADAMHWERRFGEGDAVVSSFHPIGHYPHGRWEERIGALKLQLEVEIDRGGWYWRMRRISVFGFPVPRWMFPRLLAFKRIDSDGAYRFGVRFDLSPVGMLLQYEGALRRVDVPAG